jgi:hypothetical protein
MAFIDYSFYFKIVIVVCVATVAAVPLCEINHFHFHQKNIIFGLDFIWNLVEQSVKKKLIKLSNCNRRLHHEDDYDE